MIFRKTDFRLQLDGSGKLRRRGKDGIISWYDFDMRKETELKILKFASYSEQWLDFILNCEEEKMPQTTKVCAMNSRICKSVSVQNDSLI